MQFTYEQKDHLFGQPPEEKAIGRLLTKYGRSSPDDGQDPQIQRKKLLYPANSLNYSQIYSELRIDRPDKLRPEQHGSKDSQFFPPPAEGLNYVPKSLPKIKRSRISQHREGSKYVLTDLSQESPGEAGLARVKAFSISHYDIYKNGGKRVELSEGKPRDSAALQNDLLGKGSEVFSLSLHKNGEGLKVDFESIGQKDLPQSHEQESQHNASNIVMRQPQIQPERTLEELTKDQIRIEGHEGRASKNSSHPRKVEGKREPEAGADDKEQLLSRKDSQLSRQSSIRSKQKEIRLQEIKREYSKKMQEEDYKSKKMEEGKKMQEEDNKNKNMEEENYKKALLLDGLVQGNNSGQIQLFERRIERPAELPEIKNSTASVHTNLQQSEMSEELSRFKEEISKVRKEIHGVKEEVNQVKEEVHDFKEEVHDFKEEVHGMKGGAQRESRVSEKKDHEKDTQEPTQQKQAAQRQVSVQQFEFKTAEKKVAKKQSVLIEGDQNSNEGLNSKFVVSHYIEVYEILKEVQKDLKVPQINFHGLIKGVKKYLQVVAMGGLDHVEEYEMALNRLKIIKNALLYERISVVIIAFAFAVGKVKDSLKYLINLMGYATNNTLLILKVLEGAEGTTESKNPVLAKSDRLVLKRNFDTIRNNNDIVLDSIFKISKQDEAFYEPFKEILKSIGKNSIEQTFYNVLEYFSFFLCVSELSKNLPFLAVAPNPYLRESIEKRPTLVMDIIEVFCHGTKKSKSHVFRPHTEHFLNEMGQYYELVSFTCAYPNQIDKVIDILDQKRAIKHRLYRHHALMTNNVLLKDPQRIGRDLSRLIILDSEAALMNEECGNTVVVPSWKGNRNDTTLAQLCPMLAAIALKRLDCREATRKIHEQQQKNEHAGIKYLNFGINLQ